MLEDFRMSEPQYPDHDNIPPARRQRPTQGDRLISAVMDLAGKSAMLLRHVESTWTSATFSGSRHKVVLLFSGWVACDEAEDLIAVLPGHEFEIAGALVADATVISTDHHFLPEPLMEVELELLIVEYK
jgi:hypothetical protein